MSCRVALLKLARRGVIALPDARDLSFAGRAEPDGQPDGAWPVVEMTLAELGEVWLVPVAADDAARSKQWWAMMQAHHPLGAGPLCGAQLRYLVASRAGILGGLSFSAPAWRLAPRDRWIGWDESGRQAGLSKVVANSRFLIVPTVQVPNLASHVLSLALSRLAADWQARYGVSPVLVETFVDSARWRGTCYRAANWVYLGKTQGRGRQDRTHRAAGSVKDIWMYPLHADWQACLCAAYPAPPGPMTEAADWAEQEFSGCALPDARLKERLLTLARDFYARPTANVPQACGSRAKTKAAYRFLDHPDTSMDTLLQPHYGATEVRIAQESVVLAVQDTTSLDYTTHAATGGLGPIGAWVRGPQGLHLHSTLAFTVQGTPLGFLDVQCWARDREDFGKKAKRHRLPIEEKESFKWLKSYRAVAAVQARLPKTTLVSVGDREADLYELFREAAEHPQGPKLLIRAEHNRQLQDAQARLWETLQEKPIAGIQVLRVPRQGSRAAREARMGVRFAAVGLAAPTGYQDAPAIPVWAVFAQEQEAPAAVKPLEWLLLATLPVESFVQAIEKLMWYTRRWGIEVLHRTLKSGCRIEQRQLGQADRLEACLAIDLVVAWRIYHLTKLGREVPEAPCTVYFEEAQWKALMVFTTQNRVAPAKPPPLREAIRRVASLGGFLGRKGDGEPGTQTLWLGLQRLDDIAAMWQVMTDATQTTVSSVIDSG
ncbi:MAG TPA: IS4 family transposase [Gemmatimonadaceae bacterium]|nr:IS4 family transposase [Gemmatimonadaceae bacterium]